MNATRDSGKIQPRCKWAGDYPPMVQYHDEEWGVPVHDDRLLFEFLILEGAQAGLTWRTILDRRTGYRRAFGRFDARKIARYGDEDVKRLLADAGIIRNRLKIAATILNAQRYLEVQGEFGTFDRYIWRFVDGKPIDNRIRSMKQIPATTPRSDFMSKDLKKRGFKFVGSTICYAFMQAVGMVNDHELRCFRHDNVASQSEGRHMARRS
jgi:DNA-3-methyladenine glycosylase I